MKTFSSERSAVSSYGEHHPMTNQQQQYQRSGATTTDRVAVDI
jgi:hypothetical protein